MSDVAVIRRQHRAVSVGAATSTLDAEEADERRPEGESDHAVDDEVDAGVEHEAEDVEAGQDPDGDGRVEPASRLAVVEVASADGRRVNDGVDLDDESDDVAHEEDDDDADEELRRTFA